QLGRSVLLIDADMRRPSLHKMLGLHAKFGLADVLTFQRTVSEVVQESPFSGIDIVSTGPLPPSPTELLASSSLRRALDQAVEHYDIVILDGPPMMGMADAQLLAREVDGVCFVVQNGRAHRGHAKTAVRRLMNLSGNVIGALLTKFDAKKSGYGYGYGYGYAYDYSYGKENKA
ncbi:MAG: polysaccharide biosynthesis tyrosine autokinase, partial [Alphaproteobacteria bacterium]